MFLFSLQDPQEEQWDLEWLHPLAVKVLDITLACVYTPTASKIQHLTSC